MGANDAKAARFAHRLRGEMGKRGLSQRQLGKLLDPAIPERGRRQVVRHLAGLHYPSKASRIAYAEALGLAADAFLDADDEEEEDLVAELHEMLRQQRDVMRRTDRILSRFCKTEAAA